MRFADDDFYGYGGTTSRGRLRTPTYGAAPEPVAEEEPFVELPAAEETGGGRGGGPAPVTPSAAELFALRKAPGFKAPRFTAPTREGLMADEGYQFRLGSGQNALERSAAAKGVLRTGGTLKDILEYGQKFGSQEYENAYNRALGAYDRDFQAAQAEFQPQFQEWQTGAGADLQKAMAEYDRYYGRRGGGGGGGGYEEIPPPPEFPGEYEE